MTTSSVELHGECDERFSAIRDAFVENFQKFGEVGAAVAVTIDGTPVVDLWGGVVNKDTHRPWERDTLVTVYSTTKGMTAICAHRLVDQGLLDLEVPVAQYWPEFAQAGKAEIPVHMLLSHRVGLPTVSQKLPDGAVYEWETMTDALARQKPFWEPGTRHGYHGLTYGWLVGEVVRRISGKSLGRFFRDEVAEPLGLDFHIGVDPKHADQMVRGTVVLPHGLGKSKKVCVIASGDKIKEAEQAGAEIVGGDDLVEKIAGGWVDFDACIATPDMMRGVGRLGKVLGPRGLMPNPKIGTVTTDVAKAIKEVKAGKVEFRVDKTGIIHAPVGKIEFTKDQLTENARMLIDTVLKARPAALKGKYVKRITIASTMSPGVDLDLVALDAK